MNNHLPNPSASISMLISQATYKAIVGVTRMTQFAFGPR
jgi:hypothetical protein